MQIDHVEHRRVDVFRVKGRIDSSTAPEFEQVLADKIKEGRPNLVVNLKEVEFLSSAGVRALIAAMKDAQSRPINPGTVVIAEVNPQVREVFTIAALNSLFTFYDDESTAIGSF